MSVYRSSVCPDCEGEGRIAQCTECAGNGTLPCDVCGGRGLRIVEKANMVPCVCNHGYFACATCSGGTGACGRCAGTGMLEGV